MDDIATTAMLFVQQAERYCERSSFDASQAFDLLFDSIEAFNGRHFASELTRRHFIEAVNNALSAIPGNEISVRGVELGSGAYAIEWLPHTKAWAAEPGRLK